MTTNLEIPTVNFSVRKINPQWQQHYEAIEITPAVQAFAAAVLPIVKNKLQEAESRENFAFKISTGECSWNRNRGPSLLLAASHLKTKVLQLNLLVEGRIESPNAGWIDRREWQSILCAADLEGNRS